LDPQTPSHVVLPRELGWKAPATGAMDPGRLEGWRRYDGAELAEANARLWPELGEEGYPQAVVGAPALKKAAWAVKRAAGIVAQHPSVEILARRWHALRRKLGV
jgi:hypothetical protein